MLPESEDLRPVIEITAGLAIPESELRFRFSRSSGPGGQHVQRTDTRVELLFDVAQSPSLTREQRERLMARLPNHIDGEGVLRIVSSETRSQFENRQLAVRRFQALLAMALRREKRRVPTRPSAASREQRLQSKRATSERKQTRRSVRNQDE
jgi:ribosome-associated protein